MSSKQTLLTVTVLTVLCVVAAQSAEFIGPRLEGTATLRGGQTYTGVVLTAQLGMVDGAEIGSTLKDGGYIALKSDHTERRVQATDIASLEADWVQAGTADEPKWKIAKLIVLTNDGQRLVGTPVWFLHASSLLMELPDGSRKKAYAIPMAGPSFSPDNLLTKLVLSEAAEPAETVTAPTEEIGVEPPVTEEPAIAQPATTEAPPTVETVTTEPLATEETPTAAEVITIEPVTIEEAAAVTAPPVVEPVSEGMVLADQPAIITFEIICPHTGKPIKVRFLIVPLPATE